jgi:hypothetical protein
MPGQDVDDAALAVDRERDFGARHPGGQTAKVTGEELVEGRVASIQEAIELAATPPSDEIHADVEGCRNGADHVDGQ